jgi:hypothetical protein
MLCETKVTAGWLALARWAAGVAPWNPTLAEAFAPTVISHEFPQGRRVDALDHAQQAREGMSISRSRLDFRFLV